MNLVISNKVKYIKNSLLLFLLIITSGCTQRKFTINTKPESVLCEVNGREIGLSPVTVNYVDSGYFRIRLSKPGFESYEGQFKLKKRWFNQFTLDFIGEIIPYHWVDNQSLEFTLIPVLNITHDEFKKKMDVLNNNHK
jgi:hypothetical protein